jgi:hypothetical protein
MSPTQMAIPLNMVFPETVGRCNQVHLSGLTGGAF